jgi:hypothetical protein
MLPVQARAGRDRPAETTNDRRCCGVVRKGERGGRRGRKRAGAPPLTEVATAASGRGRRGGGGRPVSMGGKCTSCPTRTSAQWLIVSVAVQRLLLSPFGAFPG